jgi:Trypsin
MRAPGVVPQRVRAATALLVVVLAATPTTVAAAAPGYEPPPATWSKADLAAVDTAGIPLITKLEHTKPRDEAQAQAISDALVFAREHPSEVGYPWIDPDSGELVVSAASANGAALIASTSAGRERSALRQVTHSFGELEAIKHEATTLRAAGVPDADLIYMTGPDPRTNRIVVVVSAPSERLFRALADRFGTETIELLVDASMRGAKPASRQADSPPFWGGASIQNQACSDGIPWKLSNSPVAMLTAAHCFSGGGSVKIGNYANVGNVTANSEENWDNVHGTQYYTGQSTYRGDVALIRLSGQKSAPVIYRGGVNSGSGQSVLSWYNRFPQNGDVVYVSGRATGETGPYTVDLVGWDILYNPPSDLWVRNVSSAARGAILVPCATNGDSGGAIYSLVSGGLKAAGVFSGFFVCRIYFTGIYDSFLALPGTPNLKT